MTTRLKALAITISLQYLLRQTARWMTLLLLNTIYQSPKWININHMIVAVDVTILTDNLNDLDILLQELADASMQPGVK